MSRFVYSSTFYPDAELQSHFDQNLRFTSISFSPPLPPSFHRWVINVKFVATPGRSFDGGTFTRQIGIPTVQSGQSVVMERQRRCLGQNLESLITDPPSKYQTLILSTLHTPLLFIGWTWQRIVEYTINFLCYSAYMQQKLSRVQFILFSVQSICRAEGSSGISSV